MRLRLDEVQVLHGGLEVRMPHPLLQGTQVHAAAQGHSRVGVAQGIDGDVRVHLLGADHLGKGFLRGVL